MFFGLFFIRPLLKIAQIPRSIMMPIIFVLCVIGSYSLSSRLFDVYTMLGFGTLIFFMRQYGYPAAPFVLGLVLGDILDKNLRRGLVLTDGDILPFFTRPISAILAALVIWTFITNVPALNAAMIRARTALMDKVFGRARNPPDVTCAFRSAMKWSANSISRRNARWRRKFGYDGMEIAPFTLSDDPPRLTAAQRKELRNTAADHGLAITSLHYLLRAPSGLSITSADNAQRARTVEVMRGLCALAADLGARILVHGSPDQRKLANDADEDGRKRGIDCFAAVADAAASSGVVYCIEPLSRDQTAFVNTIEDAASIVRQIGSPSVRTMLDCSSAALTETESIPDLIRRWLPTGMIAHVHFNDPNRRGPGDGELDFGPVLKALRDVDYRGDAAIEPFIYEPDGPACAARGIAYIRKLLDAALIAPPSGMPAGMRCLFRGRNAKMQHKTLIIVSIAMLASTVASPSLAQAPAPTPAALRHHQGRGHRERLYLPLPEPSGDVHRHARRRDRHRPDQLWSAASGENLCR